MNPRYLVVGLLLAALSPAMAHNLAPVRVDVTHIDSATFNLDVAQAPGAPRYRPRMPDGCQTDALARSSTEAMTRWQVHCRSSGADQSWSLVGAEAVNVLLVRSAGDDGRTVSRLFRSGSALPMPRQARGTSPWSAVSSGLHHFLIGWDHLLFVIGLTLYLRRPRTLVLAISSFTFGHGITLTLAAMRVIVIPSVVAELFIAASLVYLAHRLFTHDARPRTHEAWLMPLGCGLLHGLGFAGVLLASLDADVAAAWTQVLGFNIGIEIGQLLCMGCVLAVLAVLRRARTTWPALAHHASAYGIGTLGLYWCLERMPLP